MRAGLLTTPENQAQPNLSPSPAIINPSAFFLDGKVPLVNASHADVVSYSVEIIWRKAECIATLACGNRVKLADAWQFIGYTGRDPVRRLLFCNDGLYIELRVDAAQLVVASGPDALSSDCSYTTVDGRQVTLPGSGSHRFVN